jgi:Spy/CpxP family protein refolding chaperone
MGRAGGAGAQAMAGLPARAVLRLRERLNLSDDQVKKLQALEASEQTLRPSEAARMRAMADLTEAREKNNVEGVRAAMEKMSKLHTDAAVARYKAGLDVEQVLTPDQRMQLGAMRTRLARQRGMGGRGRGMGQQMRPGMGMRGRGPGAGMAPMDPSLPMGSRRPRRPPEP